MFLKQIESFDSNYLRGIAILTIMLHNYFHILDGAPGENEFSFSITPTYTYLHNLLYLPADFLKQTFSFFGHYAVQVFIFLSGYGLAMRYAKGTRISYFTFLQERFLKIYPTFFFAVILLFFYKAGISTLFPAKQMDLSSFAYEAFLKLTLLSNFIPGEALSISGPWWFFSLLFQLYLVAPLLLLIRKQEHLLTLILVSWTLQLLILTFYPDSISYLRVNLLGHLPEFILGIYIARASTNILTPLVLLSALGLFIAGSFSPFFWVISFISVPILALAAYTSINPTVYGSLTRLIIFFGKNSLYFFAVHGLCRAPFVPWGNKSVLWSIIAAIAYLVGVVIITMLFKFIVLTLTNWISNKWLTTFSKN
ncbi:acyltransferase family protein [uncultured Pontibacter sp.]|uniref:acyltransferase family protein n=1 Tax=uncultured Pontibacter sp. TaxID=453356 RepID=UPI00260FB30F|nr:acyltransferase family protein [uncultured Pontibacter sp.]